MDETVRLLETNSLFKRSVLEIAGELRQAIKNFIAEYPDVSIDAQDPERSTQRFENLPDDFLQQFTVNEQPAIVVYGANSSGKTTFIHYFLRIGQILPADVGPVTTRIVKLTYAPAHRAYARIYASLADRLAGRQPVLSIDLGRVFLDSEAIDWEDAASLLREHLVRPENQDEATFTQWARHFIELGLPSPVLQLGLDFYDTPGFLSNNRDEILNRNLYELVQTIQPTLLFLYKNSAISATDQICFLALKQALKEFGDLPKFFLNTQADAYGICKDERVNPRGNAVLEKFREALAKSRQKRYELLLAHETIAKEILDPLPPAVNDCHHFDICALPPSTSPLLQCTELMNEQTFARILQFVVHADRKSHERLAKRVLSSIDGYFDLVLSTTYRTKAEWEQLRQEALLWAEHFFARINETLPILIEDIHRNILSIFDAQRESIAARSGSFTLGEQALASGKRVSDFVRIAVAEEVLKVAASEAMRSSLSRIEELLRDEILSKKKKNELLTAAKRHIQFWEISGEELNRKKFFSTVLEHLLHAPSTINRFITKIRTRPFLDWYDKEGQHLQFELLEALDSAEHLLNKEKRQAYAQGLLTKMRQGIVEQKALYGENLGQWLSRKQENFRARIQANYHYAIEHIETRKQAYQLTRKYSEQFAKLECRIVAATDFLRFDGREPTIFEEQALGSGGFFTIHAAQWGEKRNLAVKRQRKDTRDDHPEGAFIEAHYHRAITNVRQANVVPLLYLRFDAVHDQLAIFMPKYEQSLSRYLKKNIRGMKIEQVLSFALIIALILDDLHQNDLVHRDIKSNNILLDEQNQCYLTDFGTVREGLYNQTVIGTFPLPREVLANASLQQMNVFTNYDAAAVDVFAFGVLLHELLPKTEYYRLKMEDVRQLGSLFKDSRLHPLPAEMADYQQLTLQCLQDEPTSRPRASAILPRIRALIRMNEGKACAVCLTRPRTVRTLPCGHKVLCQTCRDELRSKELNLCIICKERMQTDTEDDLNQTFYS